MDPAFAEWSKQVVLFCHVTTRVPGDPHQALLQEKGGQGFPHLVFLDAQGDVIARHQSPRSADGFAKTGEKALAFLALRKKAEGGDRSARIEVLAARLETGLPEEALKARLDELGKLSEGERARLEPLLVNREVHAVMAGVTRDKATQVDAGRRFAGMKDAGRIPAAPREGVAFWMLIIEYAESGKDVPLFEEALGKVRPLLAGNPKAQDILAQAGKRLEALKGAEPGR